MLELDHINKRLDGIDDKLNRIADTMQVVAIQGERMTHLQAQVSELWVRVNQIKEKQDQCPIESINKLMWRLQIPMAISLLGIGLKAFGVF